MLFEMEMLKMNERRRYARFSNKNVVCKLGSDHQLLNISMGGLLIKRNEDDTDQVLGHQTKCLLVYKDKEMEFNIKVVRVQDNSIAIKFMGLSAEQVGFLSDLRESLLDEVVA